MSNFSFDFETESVFYRSTKINDCQKRVLWKDELIAEIKKNMRSTIVKATPSMRRSGSYFSSDQRKYQASFQVEFGVYEVSGC